MKLINRPQYTEKIKSFIGKGSIIVLTGQRRVGKSCILQQLIREISQDEQNNTIYINKEKADFEFIKSHEELTAYVNQHLSPTKENHLFIDEVQEICEFEKTLRSLQADNKCNIIITGSNAQMLSYVPYSLFLFDLAGFTGLSAYGRGAESAAGDDW